MEKGHTEWKEALPWIMAVNVCSLLDVSDKPVDERLRLSRRSIHLAFMEE